MAAQPNSTIARLRPAWPITAARSGSRTGGIPEVVADGETGLLVPVGEPEPLAEALNVLLRDPDRAEAMGQAGRKRAVSEFGWPAIAAQTADLYAELTHSGLKRLSAP